MRRSSAMLLSLLLVGCGDKVDSWSGDPNLYNLHLEKRSKAQWLASPDLSEDVRRVVELTAAQFHHGADEVAGYRILFVDGDVDCPSAPINPGAATFGCTDWDERTVTLRADVYQYIEQTPIAHELLHVFIGDPEHLRPEWQELPAFGSLLMCLHHETSP